MNGKSFFSKTSHYNSVLKLGDIATIFIAGYGVHIVRFGELISSEIYQLFLLALALLAFNIFNTFSVYKPSRGEGLYRDLTRLTLGWITVILTISALTFITKTGVAYSRLWAGWTFVSAYAGMIALRLVFHMLISSLRAKGYNQKNIVIIGAGNLGKLACDALFRNPWVGIRPIVFFDDDPACHNLRHNNVEVIGDTDKLVGFIEARRVSKQQSPVDQVWIALPLSAVEKIQEIQAALQDTATKVFLVPDVFGFNLASNQVSEVAGLPIMNMSAPPMNNFNSSLKRAEDFTLATMLLAVLSPLFLLIGVLIKLESTGPIFFKQRRYGAEGKEILVWKFRSMTVTEDGDQVVQAQRDDQRVTKLGGWLRKLSFDELPQLINVFLGSMSLVGPRPHAVAHNEFYRKKVPGYMTRHQIKPGITGLAQINGCRGETAKLEDMEQRVQYDLEYIRNWTPFLDLKILFLTIPTLIENKDTY